MYGYFFVSALKPIDRYSISIFEYLLQQNVIDINALTFDGMTALGLSMHSKTCDYFAKRLIEEGADIHILNTDSFTALHLAVQQGFHDVSHLLLKKGADPNLVNANHENCLHLAAEHSDIEMVSMLLYYGTDADCFNRFNRTPFMVAVSVSADEAVQRLLLDFEVDLNATTVHNISTLLLALTTNSPLVEELIDRGANVNFSNGYDNAVLAALSHPSMLKFIWPKFRYNEVYMYTDVPLLDTIIDSIDNHEILSILLTTNNAYDMLHHSALHLCFYSNLLTTIIQVYYERGASESTLYPIICLCLFAGIDANSFHVQMVYDLYGFNEIIYLFLHMDIDIINGNLIHDLWTNTALYVCNPFLEINALQAKWTKFEYSDIKFRLSDHLNFFTPSIDVKETLSSIFNLPDFRDMIEIRRKIKKLNVPSLTELSRNAARKFIASQVQKSTQFYYTIKHLNLPNRVKHILILREPVNYFSE